MNEYKPMWLKPIKGIICQGDRIHRELRYTFTVEPSRRSRSQSQVLREYAAIDLFGFVAYNASEEEASRMSIHDACMRYAQQQDPRGFYTRLTIKALHHWTTDTRDRVQRALPKPHLELPGDVPDVGMDTDDVIDIEPEEVAS